MKKLLFILFVVITPAVMAQNARAVFDNANKLYTEEKYAEAAAQYELIVDRYKEHSADLYYNLGNSYYKLNKVGPAVYNYEKGLMLEPGNNAIANNLKFAHQMMLDEVREVPLAGFSHLVQGFTGQLSYDTWAWMAVGFGFLFLAAFAGYYFIPNPLYKRILFFVMLLMLLLMIVSASSGFYEKERLANERPAIVFATAVPVKGEPKTNASDAATIHEGTKVYVLEELGEWKRVVLPDGNDGWIESAAIKELK